MAIETPLKFNNTKKIDETFDIEISNKDKDDSANTPSKEPHHKFLVVLGIDMSEWKPIKQYFFLSVSMMASMCIYAYLQEYIIYGWFNRKFSFFTSFLHFIGK